MGAISMICVSVWLGIVTSQPSAYGAACLAGFGASTMMNAAFTLIAEWLSQHKVKPDTNVYTESHWVNGHNCNYVLS